MTIDLGRRLDRLAPVLFRPPAGCTAGGSHCQRLEVVRIGRSDPPPPVPIGAEACRRCGRPTFTRSYLLVVDGAERAEEPA